MNVTVLSPEQNPVSRASNGKFNFYENTKLQNQSTEKKFFFLPNLQQSHTIKIIEIYQELEKQ